MGVQVAVLGGVVAGEFGKTIQLVCLDADGVAQDISAYTGDKTLVARSPDTKKTVTATCSFVSGGIDGKVQFSFASGDIDRAGDWDAQLELNIGSTTLSKSDPFLIRVRASLR